MEQHKIVIYLVGYIFLTLTSGFVLRIIFLLIGSTGPKPDPIQVRSGIIIGKCENILILSLMFLSAYTALSLIFTAKAFVRKDDIEKNPVYFLVGTLVNFTYSLMIGMGVKLFISLINNPCCLCCH